MRVKLQGSPSPVLALALALRLAWALAVPVVPLSDSHAYDVFAQNLALHDVYGWEVSQPSAYWPVGTSFLYSLLYRMFGVRYWPIVALNILLGVLITWLTMVLARRWFGRRVGIIAGILVACWPSLIEFTTVLASELPFIALVLGATALWFGEGRTPGRATVVGVLLAAASYVRPTALLLPLLFAALSAARGEARSRTIAAVATVGVVMVLVVSPWAIRNTLLFDRFVLISTNGGANTWMGNNPSSTGYYMELPPLEDMDEAARDAYLAREARRHVVEHPLRFAKATAVKLLRLHERESIGVSWNAEGLRRQISEPTVLVLKVLGNVFWWMSLLLSLVGVFILARRHGLAVMLEPALAIWTYFAAVHAVTVIQDRYHFPSIPFIAMLAATSIAAVFPGRPEGEAGSLSLRGIRREAP